MSGRLRTQIGQTKRRLLQTLSNIEEDIDAAFDLSTADDDALQNHYDQINSLHDALLKSFSKLEQLDHEWSAMMTNNPDEANAQETYITKFGNYKDDMDRAVLTLEQIDINTTHIEQELDRRNLPRISTEDPGSPDEGSDRFNQAFDAQLPPNFSTPRLPHTPLTSQVQYESTPQHILMPPPHHRPAMQPPVNFSATPATPATYLATHATQPNTTPSSVPPMVFTRSPGLPPLMPMPPPPQTPMPPPPALVQPPPTTPTVIIQQGPQLVPTSLPYNVQNIYPQQMFSSFDAALLTRLDLPDFSGDIIAFPEYWSRFTALVDSKPIGAAAKFSLLKSTLRGEALQSIQGIPVTDDNYVLAVDILRSNYDDRSTIRHILYTKLFNLPACDDSGKKLQSLFNEMQKLVRQYVALDTTDSKEYGLAAILLNKLPKAVRSKVYDKNPDHHNITPLELLNILSDIVKKEVKLTEMNAPATVRPQDSYHVNQQSSRHRPSHQGGPPPPSSNNRKEAYPRCCVFCGRNNHFTTDCRTHRTSQERSQIARDRRLCFNCLRDGHSSAQCPSRFTCRHCRGHHHTALCSNAPIEHPPGAPRHAPPHRTHAGNFDHHQPMPAPSPFYRPAAPPAPTQRPQPPAQQGQQQKRWNYTGRQVNQRSATTAQIHYVDTTSTNCSSAMRIGDLYATVAQLPPTTAVSTQAQPLTDLHVIATAEENDLHEEEESVLLMCTEVTLVNPKDPSKTLTTTAFLDSGSNRSYISKDIAIQLDLNVILEEDLVLNVFGEQKSRLPASLHMLGLHLNDGSTKNMSVKALPILTNQMKAVKISEGQLTHLRTEKNLPTTDVKPGLLIGNDYFWELLLNKDFYWETLPSGYRLLNSKIGPIITGKNDNCIHHINVESLNTATESDSLSNTDNLERFWNFESVGMTEEKAEKDDDACMNHFNNTIRFSPDDNRYMVKWPFRLSPENLPTNKELAVYRLRSNWTSLSKKPDNLTKYHNILADQLEKGIIEAAPVSNGSEDGHHHYLAHHAVITENKKTTKVRMVFDGSAKQLNRLSINEHLHKGPCLVPDICGVLLRARLAPILVSSDIEKAFLMIGLELPDRDYVKFFWLKDYQRPPTYDNLIVYRFRRVPFGIISSPFLLSATIQHHIREKGPACTALLRNLYVDNCFVSCSSTSDAIDLYKTAKTLFKEAGMNLREWCSNDPAFNKFIMEAEQLETLDPEQNILGLKWHTTTDTLVIRIPSIDRTTIWTKRKILTTVASTFDPLGLLIPATLPGKHYLQSLWKENMDWDQKINSNMSTEWDVLLDNFFTRDALRLPRLVLLPFPSAIYSLHIFCDASKNSYAAAAYLRQQDGTIINVRLIFAKSRLSPIKNATTIPRLELSAITIASSIAKYLHKELDLKIASTFIWSDSKVALLWLKSGKHLPVFIQNRVKSIQTNAPLAQLRHVPSELNPADIASRGCPLDDLLLHHLWWSGPPFLLQPEDQWPPDIITPTTDLPNETTTHYVSDIAAPTINPMIDVLKTTTYSNWDHLITMTTFVLFFLMKKLRTAQVARLLPFLTSDLRTSAMMCLFRRAQQDHPPTEKLMSQLELFMDPSTGLYRCRGRMVTLNLTEAVRHPIFLPRESHITRLFILYIHRLNLHSGTSLTLIHLRQSVWIPRGRSTVKSALHHDCHRCRRYQAMPFQLPQFPDYPEQRTVQPPYPFWNAAMDYCGPFTCKDGHNEKIYICIFTCLNTRAIYVDVALDMTAHTFLNILRRFIASHGSPHWLLSDNAAYFTCTAEAFRLSYPHEDSFPTEVLDYCKKKSISFKFVPAHSPWSGGIYERMIGIFKQAFKFAVGRTQLRTDDLRTICKEVEAIINSRPLTYVPSDDLDQFIEPIRPIDFVRPGALVGTPRFDTTDDEWKPVYSTQDTLVSEWIHFTAALDKFWTRWSSEYLTALREKSQRTHHQGRLLTKRTPILGEVVMIHEEFCDRGQWKLARIAAFNDDEPRSVRLLLPNRKYITRPISLIYPLEVSDSMEQHATLPEPPLPQQHAMVTRSKAKLLNASNILTVVTIFTLLTPATGLPPIHTVPNTRCPDDPSLPRTIFYGDSCTKEGVVIAYYQAHDQPQRICWFPVQCPIGHLRFDVPVPLNTAYCGAECHCPSWTTQCSHYNGSRVAESTIKHIPSSMYTFVPDHVCSFKNSTLCSPTKRLGVFSQIELFDGSQLIVSDLHIDMPDQVHKNDFICFTASGLRSSASADETDVTGTSAFCSQFPCTTTNPRLFCTFPIAPTFFEYKALRVPVRAWGHAAKEYYPALPDGALSPNEYHYIRCSKGGVQIFTSNLHFVEACISTTCVYLTNYTEATAILFPTAFVIYTYNISVTAWKHGVMILQDQLQCPGHPICEVISCTLCQEHLYNYQCWTWTEVFVSIVIWFLLTFLYYVLRPTCQLLRILLLIILYPLRRILQLVSAIFRCRKKPIPANLEKSDVEPALFKSRYRRRTRLPATIAVLLLLIPDISIACSDITTFTAGTTSCTTDGLQEVCRFEQATIMTLQPLGQESCLLLRNQKNEPIGVLSIRLTGIKNICNKKDSFYTRDHSFTTESTHRCYKAGSCQEDRCATTKTRDRLAEFSSRANDQPGYTFCVGSCQCVTCDKCFLCEPSCLFYRYFAVPSGDAIYTVYKCPTWSLYVSGTATLQTANTSTTTTFNLLPARKFAWNAITMTLTGTTSPHLPILGNTFLTDGLRTSMIGDTEAGYLAPNSPGQLQCSTWNDAKAFKCSFAPGVCTCSPSSYSVKCTCPDGSMKKYLDKNTLPLVAQGIALLSNGPSLHAVSETGSAVQLQIVMEGVSIATRREINHCTATTTDLEGCYSCTTGATFDLVCVSSIGEETADIRCGDQAALAICSINGTLNTIHLNYDHSTIHENCTLSCAGGLSSFALNGTLHFVSEAVFANPEDVVNIDQNKHEDDDFSFAQIALLQLSNLFEHWKIILACIIAICIIGLTLYLYLVFKQISFTRKII